MQGPGYSDKSVECRCYLLQEKTRWSLKHEGSVFDWVALVGETEDGKCSGGSKQWKQTSLCYSIVVFVVAAALADDSGDGRND